MPAREDGDAKTRGGDCAEDAYVAGASEVNDVRVEIAQSRDYAGPVAGESKIEAHVVVEGDAGKGALEVELDVVTGGGELRLIAGVDAEEGEVAAACKGIEIAAGMGHAIDLVEGICEESYAHR